jgi:spore coat polysaccharide biosynthesis protein SpsF
MKKSRIVAIVRARMGSARLPGKVLMPIGIDSMLQRVVARIERMRTIDDFVVATSVCAADDALAHVCASEGWHCFRGPEQDVLERCLRAAQAMQATDIVDIPTDCPLFSWQQADRLIAHHVASGSDCAHNLTARGCHLPIGGGVEVLTVDALGMAWTYGIEPHHREHISDYIHENPERFKIDMLPAPEALDRPFYRFTVDTPSDLRLVRSIQERVEPSDGVVDMREAIALLDQDQELSRSNQESKRRAG